MRRVPRAGVVRSSWKGALAGGGKGGRSCPSDGVYLDDAASGTIDFAGTIGETHQFNVVVNGVDVGAALPGLAEVDAA